MNVTFIMYPNKDVVKVGLTFLTLQRVLAPNFVAEQATAYDTRAYSESVRYDCVQRVRDGAGSNTSYSLHWLIRFTAAVRVGHFYQSELVHRILSPN